MRFALVFSALILSGCIFSGKFDKRSFVGLEAEPAKTRLGTAVFVECVSGGIGSLSGSGIGSLAYIVSTQGVIPIVPGIASELITNVISKTLEEWKEGLNGQFLAMGVATGKFDTGCTLFIVKGLFGPEPLEGTKLNPKSVCIGERMKGFGLVDYPVFYLKLNVGLESKSGENKMLTLTPTCLIYAASSARYSPSNKKNVSVVVAMGDSVQKDLASTDGKEFFTVFRFDFGRLEIGKYYEGTEILNGTKVSLPVGKYIDNTFNIAALVTESEAPDIAFSALTEAFAIKKPEFQKFVEDWLKKIIGKQTGGQAEN